jgi:hypothetical protein
MHLRVYAAYLRGLLTMPILPARFTPTVRQMTDRLEKLLGEPEAASVDLAGTAGIAGEALRSVERLDAAADARGQGDVPDEVAATLNGALKGLSRVLIPLGGTVAGRYGHDPYGLSAQATVLPGLYELSRLGSLPPTSDERYLLQTELRRQRNRFADGMQQARDLADRALATLDG